MCEWWCRPASWVRVQGAHLARGGKCLFGQKGILPSSCLKKGSLPWLGFPTSLVSVSTPPPPVEPREKVEGSSWNGWGQWSSLAY